MDRQASYSDFSSAGGTDLSISPLAVVSCHETCRIAIILENLYLSIPFVFKTDPWVQMLTENRKRVDTGEQRANTNFLF